MPRSPKVDAAIFGRAGIMGGNRNRTMAKIEIECIVWLTLMVSINVDRRMS
jgi:hypothetical protein